MAATMGLAGGPADAPVFGPAPGDLTLQYRLLLQDLHLAVLDLRQGLDRHAGTPWPGPAPAPPFPGFAPPAPDFALPAPGFAPPAPDFALPAPDFALPAPGFAPPFPGFTPIAAPGSQASREPGLLAARLVAEANFAVSNARDNAYVHELDIRPEIGRYRTDCSGLLYHLIRQVDPGLLAAIGSRRPVARQYYRHFAAAPPAGQAAASHRWARVSHGADLRPGDVIAREYIPPRPGATGHVLVVTEPPRAVVHGGRVVAYDVRIVDDARHPHEDDTRRSGGAGGVGSGVISLLVDEAGRMTGLQRSRYRGGAGGGPIAVGRINEAARVRR